MMKQPDWGMGTVVDEKISQFDWPTGDTSCHGKQISVNMRELAPETDSCNIFAPARELAPSYQTSLIRGSKTREQKFSLEIVGADEGALFWERVAGARSLVCWAVINKRA